MMTINVKKIRNYAIGSLVIITIFFTIIELATRTVSWFSGKGFTLALHELEPYDRGIKDIYKWHPFTGFTLHPEIGFYGSHPNQQGKAFIVVGKYGFLADPKNELVEKKSSNEIRIATIGASTTANIGLTYQQNWPGYLGKLLRKRFPRKKITILNAGVPGFDTAQSIGNLALRVMAFKPDVVIIYHAYNDLKAIRPNRKFSFDYSHVHPTPYGYHKEPMFLIRLLNRSMFYVRLRNKYREYAKKENVIKTKRTNGIPKVASETFERNIRTLVAIARANNAKVILSSYATLHNLDWDYSDKKVSARLSKLKKMELYGLMYFTPELSLEGIMRGLKKYNDILRKVAIDTRSGWVDNAGLVPHEDRFFVDRVHFTKEGAAVMAKNFLPEVIRQLRRKK